MNLSSLVTCELPRLFGLFDLLLCVVGRLEVKYAADLYCSVTTLWSKSLENLSGDGSPLHVSFSATLERARLSAFR